MYRPALVVLALLAGCAQPTADPETMAANKVPAPTVTNLSEGRARDLCRNAIQAEKFTVLEIVEVAPAPVGGRARTGTALTMRIAQLGDRRTVRCTFTDATGRVDIAEL